MGIDKVITLIKFIESLDNLLTILNLYDILPTLKGGINEEIN